MKKIALAALLITAAFAVPASAQTYQGPCASQIATTTKLGCVKPDGSTITVTNQGVITAVGGGGGGVSSVSVVTANGLAGTVATPTSTPAITLSTSVNGLAKGNGTALSAATAGTDYAAPGTAATWTALQKFTGSDFSILGSSTGYTAVASANASGTNYTVTFPAATDTVDLIATAQTLANKTISGSSNTLSNIGNGSLTNSSMTLAGHSVSLGGTQAFACGDLSNGATGCSTATGTSGATIPLLNGVNTWSAVQSVNSGDLSFNGSGSGASVLNAPATGGGTLTLPPGTDTIAGIAATQILTNKTLTSPALGGTVTGSNTIPLSILAQAGANTLLGNATGSTANVTAVSVNSCSTSASALLWTAGSGFSCNTNINASNLQSANWASPLAIGSSVPAAGTFTTLTANTTLTAPDASTWSAAGISDTATYATSTTTAPVNLNYTNSFSSTANNVQGLVLSPIMTSAGASAGANVIAIEVQPTLASSSNNITQWFGFNISPLENSSYTGTVSTAKLLSLSLSVSGNPISTLYYGYAGVITNGSGITTGTVNNFGLNVASASAVAGSGGTINNTGVAIALPSGTNAGTETAIGLQITGNGVTGGTSTNYAIDDTSTAPVVIDGVMSGMPSVAVNGCTIGSNAFCVTGSQTVSGGLTVGSTQFETGGAVIASSFSTAVASSSIFDYSSGARWIGIGPNTSTVAKLTGIAQTSNGSTVYTATFLDSSGNTQLPGTLTVSGLATGTNADFVCANSSLTLLVQTTACTISKRQYKIDRGPVMISATKELMALQTVQFTMKPMDRPNPDVNFLKPQYGFYAEDVAAVDKQLSVFDADGKTPKSWRETSVIALMALGFQEHNHEIGALKFENENLRKRLVALEKRVR